MRQYITLGSPAKIHMGMGVDCSNWVIGFGWIRNCIHLNLGPFVIFLASGLR